MAAQELIDRMAAVYAAYNEGDAEPFFGLFAEDGLIRFVAPPDVYPFAAPRRGPTGARARPSPSSMTTTSGSPSAISS